MTDETTTPDIEELKGRVADLRATISRHKAAMRAVTTYAEHAEMREALDDLFADIADLQQTIAEARPGPLECCRKCGSLRVTHQATFPGLSRFDRYRCLDCGTVFDIRREQPQIP